MQPNATGLSAQQERAVEMLAAGQRVVAVARALRIDRTTLWRWMGLPAVQEALEACRVAVRSDAASRLRHNVLVAAEALGSILESPRTAARDRISAARVVLGMVANPLNEQSSQAQRGEPAAGWSEVVLATANRAAEMSGQALALLFAHTPGVAWKQSGLESAFPGSFARVRALADHPQELRAECDRVLTAFGDRIDAETLGHDRPEQRRAKTTIS